MKKLTCFLLVLSFAVGLVLPAQAAGGITTLFPADHDYRGFDDVKPADWFSTPVRYCAFTGLMTGADTGFEPYMTLTVGEIAAIAARMNERITGETIPFPEDGKAALPWYASYLTYLEEVLGREEDHAHILERLAAPEYSATRQDFVDLISAVVPETYFPPINTIATLPDTSDPTVLAFYNAGILTGVNTYGTFAGERTLTRAECAAMVGRVIRPTLRESFSPAAQGTAPDVLYLLGLDPQSVCFTWCGLSVDAQTYLDVLTQLYSDLVAEKAQEGNVFSWDLTRNSGANEVPVLEYLEDWTPYYALQRIWNEDEVIPFPTDNFNAYFVSLQEQEPAPTYLFPINVREVCDGWARLHPIAQEVTP